jgi:hypothetical protein
MLRAMCRHPAKTLFLLEANTPYRGQQHAEKSR